MNGTYNIWIINLGRNLENLFLFIIFYQLIKNKKFKKWMLISVAGYEVFFITNYFLSGSWNTFQIYPLYVGDWLMIIILLYFLSEMFTSDSVLQIHRYVVFWIATGFLIYKILPFPTQIGYLLFEDEVYNKITNFVVVIQHTANLLLYIFLIIGILWSTQKYES
jgi:hypothetical protein